MAELSKIAKAVLSRSAKFVKEQIEIYKWSIRAGHEQAKKAETKSWEF
jgi:hypothetical protein